MIRSALFSIILLTVLGVGLVGVYSYDDRVLTPTPTAIPGSPPDLTVKINPYALFLACPSPLATINVTVINAGGSDTGAFTLRMNGVTIPVENMEMGTMLVFSYEHSVLRNELELRVEVDAKNTVAEADERNNYDAWILRDDRLNREYRRYCTPTPSRGKPDLVASVRYNDGDECDTARIIEKVIIENLGDVDAGAFTVQLNGVEIEVPGLEAYDRFEILLRELNMKTLTLQVDIDLEQEVWETNEDNNSYLWMPSTIGAYWEYLVYCTPVPPPT
ncbi:MAG: hypothetical protein K8I82_14530 [Anaerolineae bacterium]|nr:hypothetical protein [Anaerolineae bacterium]